MSFFFFKRRMVKRRRLYFVFICFVGLMLFWNISEWMSSIQLVIGPSLFQQLFNLKNTSSSIGATGSKGEFLARQVQQKCLAMFGNRTGNLARNRPLDRPRALHRISVSSNSDYNIMFCPMAKLASTYWTRFFYLLPKYTIAGYDTPYDIPIADAPGTKEVMLLKQGIVDEIHSNMYKFMFVREPYNRLLSAYVDKIFAPNPFFWKSINSRIQTLLKDGNPVRRCGADISFNDYVEAVGIAHEKQNGDVDQHDATFISKCNPCTVAYNFVGKMESFAKDALFIYEQLGLNRSIQVLKKNGKNLADEDALLDTVSSPFQWKDAITKCISWREALLRIWRKLQIRGVLGKDRFPLNDHQVKSISKTDFILLIKATQARTSVENRHSQRHDAFVEIYKTVSMANLKKIQSAFSLDFHLFDYNDRPDSIYNRKENTFVPYGYLNVTG